MSSVKHTTIKTVGYRIISWGSTTALAWIVIGGSVDASSIFIFSIVDMIANTIIYFLYERAWINGPQLLRKLRSRKAKVWKKQPLR